MVKPTTTLQAAHVQKLFDIEVKNPPVINVAKQVKKDNLLPILYNNKIAIKYTIPRINAISKNVQLPIVQGTKKIYPYRSPSV